MAEVAASTCLTLSEIENELSEVTGADWYPLGVQLGLRLATLREIKKNYPLDTERCKQEVLHLWLCNAPEASWKNLAQAVQALGRYTFLAQKLRKKLPSATKVPSAPTIVSVQATSSTSISVQWNASKNGGDRPITDSVVEYHVASEPESPFETQVVARDISTNLDGLAPSTEYDVNVRGENAVGHSVPSQTKKTKTDDEVEEEVDSTQDLPRNISSSVGGLEGNKMAPSLQEEIEDTKMKGLLKTLRESIKAKNVDSFHHNLNELERVVQNNERMKRLLEQDGTLCYAAYIGSNPVVETLIQKGVDINAISRVPGYFVKASPLHFAVDKGHFNTVMCLLEKGADLHNKDGVGWTSLHQAAVRGHIDIVRYLIGKGAETNIKDNYGWTPLHRAANKGHVETARLLVEKAADINAKETGGYTPLHRAAMNCHVETAQLLVEKGADISIKDNDGRTPHDLAAECGHEKVVAYLEGTVDPNMMGKTESTGRQQEQRKSPEETDNSPCEEPPATAEIGEETEESDHEEIDCQLENLLQKYRHHPTIKHKSLKCLFTGPPCVGKTTLKMRLLKTIKNLLNSDIVSPSGGLEKPITVVIGETRECVPVLMQSDTDWKPQVDLLDEAQIVLEFIDKTHDQSLVTPDLKPVPPKQGTAPVPEVHATPVSTTTVPSVSGSHPPKPREDKVDPLDDAKILMQEVLSSRKLRSIKDIEKTTTLYFIDTGGQPEFQEIMPIILSGPALHLIFFNLSFDLDDLILVRFCQKDGNDSTITYNSSYTGKQMIYQLLSSLYYLSKGLPPHSKPAAVLIGTHLDQLEDQGEKQNEERNASLNTEGQKKSEDISDSYCREVQIKVEEINHSLKEFLSNAEFHDRAFLTYPKKDKKSTIFVPVNNYSGDEKEIHNLQAFLRQVIFDRFPPLELPSSWLLFHLVLRHRYENSPGVCKLADCQALAKGCGLDKDDILPVLRYLHQHLGTILFYEEVEGLSELVICDPNVLFKSIYQLVAVSFGGDKGYLTITDEIRKTGEIPCEVLEDFSTEPSNSLLTNELIINLLKHYKILKELRSDYGITYFMPCLLQPDNTLDLSCKALQKIYPPPLLFGFDGKCIPVGMFSALVVKLSWKPARDSRYCNHILFDTDDVFPVELIVHPAYLEFRIRVTNHNEEQEEIHKFCSKVRNTVVDTLKSILDLHEHTRKIKFQLGFYCPGSFQTDAQPHFSGCLPCQNHTNPKSFVCSKSPRCQDQCRLPHECTVWLEYWKDKESVRDRGYSSVGKTSRTAGAGPSPATGQLHRKSPTSTTLEIPLTPDDLGRLKVLLQPVAGQWEELADQLQMTAVVEIIHNTPKNCSPAKCLRDLLNRWISKKERSSTVGKLCRALIADEEIVGGSDVANKLEEEFIGRRGTQPESMAVPQQPEFPEDDSEPKFTDDERKSLMREIEPITLHIQQTDETTMKAVQLFARQVVLVLHTCNSNEYWAALQRLEPPTVNDRVIFQDRPIIYPQVGSVIGWFAGYRSAVVRTEQGNKCRDELMKAFTNSFPNGQVIIGAGIAFANDRRRKFADVLISNQVENFVQYKKTGDEITNRGPREEIDPNVQRIFVNPARDWTDMHYFPCADNDRTSVAHIGCVVSTPMLIRDEVLRDQLIKHTPNAIGGEMEGWVLLELKKTLKYQHKKDIEVIVIKGVANYGDLSKGHKWQWTAAKAAMDCIHYCLRKSGGIEFNAISIAKREDHKVDGVTSAGPHTVT